MSQKGTRVYFRARVVSPTPNIQPEGPGPSLVVLSGNYASAIALRVTGAHKLPLHNAAVLKEALQSFTNLILAFSTTSK
jgi:hypothetical protein